MPEETTLDEPGLADEPGTPPTTPPARRRRVGWGLRVVLLLVVAGLVALGLAGMWLRSKLDPSGPPGAAVRVEIPQGSTTAEIATLLADAGVVPDARVFRVWVRFRGPDGFQAGSYELRRNSSVGEALDDLAAGPSLPPATNLTIPEGLTIPEIAERVGKVEHLDPAAFLVAAQSGQVRSTYLPAGSTNLEGFLFPETYRIQEDEDEREVLERMVTTFEQVAGAVGLAQAPQRVGVSPYEAVIVASLIEAEAKSDVDRAKIARVIYNRLRARMPLGIDAAFYYELGPERKGTSLRQSDLQRDTPYNTRTRVGLIPTPIMAPSQASLAAALAPEEGPWLYYVLKDATTHAFSESYQEFLRNKAAAQRAGLIP
jgi:UPF0755 protein